MKTRLQVMVVAAAIAAPMTLLAADTARSFVVVDQSAALAQLPFSDAAVKGAN